MNLWEGYFAALKTMAGEIGKLFVCVIKSALLMVYSVIIIIISPVCYPIVLAYVNSKRYKLRKYVGRSEVIDRLFRKDASDRDWTEDFQYENGNYQNVCVKCFQTFYGNKHRCVCRLCDKSGQGVRP